MKMDKMKKKAEFYSVWLMFAFYRIYLGGGFRRWGKTMRSLSSYYCTFFFRTVGGGFFFSTYLLFFLFFSIACCCIVVC